MSDHAWCSDPARDEAVRAAEDGRQGPLPTLEDCIETARAMMPKSVLGSSEVIALRARVAELESASAPAANAGGVSDPEQISDDGKTNRQGKLDSSQEPVAWGVMVNGNIYRSAGSDALFIDRNEAGDWCGAAALYGTGTVVPLYAAPVAESATTPQPPRGWLTDGERRAIEEGAYALVNDGYYGARAKAELLRALLARSTPPRVKVPKYFPMSWAHERDDAWIAAIREAGGEVE